jgi:pyruvate/2-oxoglutarate dehydrogenase complex dihydrolipoamide dehydrogenase (E3) component
VSTGIRRGRARRVRVVRVGEHELSAREAIVIAVGSGAAMPPIPGLAEARPWTSREATTARSVPARLLVLGGGMVGVEMAYAYTTLGSRVTLIESLERLIAREEPFASEQVVVALTELGVDVRVGVTAQAVHRDSAGATVELSGGASVEGDEILVGVGRRPRTQDLGLETVGLEPGRAVEVDEQMRVPGLPWLYAIGDATGRALLTHIGKDHAHVASAVIAGRARRASGDDARAPRVVFTEPPGRRRRAHARPRASADWRPAPSTCPARARPARASTAATRPGRRASSSTRAAA